MSDSVTKPLPVSSEGKSSFLPTVLSVSTALFLSVFLVQLTRGFTDTEVGTATFATLLMGLLGTWLGFATGIAWAAGFSYAGLRDRLGLRFELRDVPLGLALGVFCQLVMVFVIYLPIQLIAPDTYETLGDPAREMSDLVNGWNIVIFAIAVGFIAPLLEELTFRGMVLRAGLTRWTAPLSVFVSSMLFGLMHFQALQTLALVAFAAVLATVAYRTNRLGLSIFAHVGFNLTTVAVLAFS